LALDIRNSIFEIRASNAGRGETPELRARRISILEYRVSNIEYRFLRVLRCFVAREARNSMSEPPMKFSHIRVLVFDLDGTLIDSSRDLAGAVNVARERMGLGPLSHAQVMTFIGNGARELVRRGISFESGAASDAEIDSALGFFREHYAQHLLDQTQPYPGVRETLDVLSSRTHGPPRTLAVLTNKPLRFTRPILDGLGLAPYFRYIYGEDSFPAKKPDPVGLLSILHDTAAAPREALLVGDSEIDVHTARNAGVNCVGVSYGLSSGQLVACPPDVMLDTLLDLPALLG
jgi:phosphoglycolate phosphatase